jgi:AcrR family transcriptional regulator
MRQTSVSARPRKRLKRLDESKRAALLDAAVEEIAEYGLEAFSLQRVAARAGITRGLVYYYWDDREELLREVVEHLRAILIDTFKGWGTPDDPESYWSSVERVYGQAFLSLAGRPRHLELFRRLLEAAQAQQAPEAVREIISDARSAMSRLLAIGQKLRAVRTDLPASLLLEAAFVLAGASDAWAIRQVAAGAAPASCVVATMKLLRSAIERPSSL